MASLELLFSKRLPVTIKSSERDNRFSHIHVAIETQTVTTPVHKQELVVRLTDELDLFFLFTLRLDEEDFQSLKTQQGLLVDFTSFPQKFIDLLELCNQEEHKESPKFILELVCSSGTANLNVIETNPFKFLTHLSLRFLPGNDAEVKKYLAECLKTLKEQKTGVDARLASTETELSQQLRQAREALSARTIELDNLRAEWNTKTGDLSLRHKQEVASEREKSLASQRDTHQRYERERKELEQAHMKIVKQMESRIYEIENSNKDLTDRKYKSESTIREQKSKLNSLEEELHRTKQDLQTLRKDNAALDADFHEQEKVNNQLRTRLAVTEQEIKDKEQVLAKSTDLLSTEQGVKRKVEEEIDKRKRQVAKLEASIKTMSEELVKGNEIIKKLQGEIKNYHTKLKLRNQVTTEQEKLLQEKNREMEEIRRDLEVTKTNLRHKEEENKKINDTLETTQEKLGESQQLLKTNENVINYLNKQLTQNQMGTLRSGPFELNSTASSTATQGHRHAPLHNFSQPSYQGSARHSSPGSHHGHSPPQLGGHGEGHLTHKPQVQYTPGAAPRSSLPQPLAKSSPLDRPGLGATGTRSSPQASPALLSQQKTQPRTQQDMDPFLDSKYLQRGGELPARTPAPRSASPNQPSLHFSAPNPRPSGGAAAPNPRSHNAVSSAYNPRSHNPVSSAGHSAARTTTSSHVTVGHSVTHPGRLSRDVIAPRTAPQKSSQPPLASAYFPNQAKVT